MPRPSVRLNRGSIIHVRHDEESEKLRGDTGFSRLLFRLSLDGPISRRPGGTPAHALDVLLGEDFRNLRGRWSAVAYSYAFAVSAEKAGRCDTDGVPDDTRNRFYYAWVPFDTPLAEFVADLGSVEGIDAQSLTVEPPVTTWEARESLEPELAAENFDAFAQPWLGEAGINVLKAWQYPGARGQEVQVADIEQGWTFDHIDLYDTANPDRIRRVYGMNQAYMGHGTAVLGILAARENGKGCTGAVPEARIRCYAIIEDSGWDVPLQWAIDAAVFGVDPLRALKGEPPPGGSDPSQPVEALRAGDILLIEDQGSLPDLGVSQVPAEVREPVFVAIKEATNREIIVVEPAGNGGFDLDDLAGRPDVQGLGYGTRDSGAILVGASTAGENPERLGSSCYGNRINCHAWGEGVFTTGDGWEGNDRFCYTLFGGTSAAAAQVAAAAAAIQGAHRSVKNRALTPMDMRNLLVQTGRPSADPSGDRVGVLPDTEAAIRQFAGEPPGSAPAYPNPADNDLSDVQLCGSFGAVGDSVPAGLPLAPVFFALGLLTGVVLMLI
jgi:subtilisin family serine protease